MRADAPNLVIGLPEAGAGALTLGLGALLRRRVAPLARRLLDRADAWSGGPPSDDCTMVPVDWAG